jgi:hypothetical protein
MVPNTLHTIDALTIGLCVTGHGRRSMSHKVIRKYKLDNMDDLGLANYVRVDMPKGAKIINVSHTFGFIYLHAIVNPKHKEKERWFAVFNEVVPIEDYEKKTFEYIGMVNGVRLYHVFEVHD